MYKPEEKKNKFTMICSAVVKKKKILFKICYSKLWEPYKCIHLYDSCEAPWSSVSKPLVYKTKNKKLCLPSLIKIFS